MALISVIAIALSAFPYYSKVFFKALEAEEALWEPSGKVEKILINVEGLTCQGCEAHVNEELSSIPGILKLATSYKEGNTKISFDPTHTSADSIISVITKTEYTVNDYTTITE